MTKSKILQEPTKRNNTDTKWANTAGKTDADIPAQHRIGTNLTLGKKKKKSIIIYKVQ